MNITNVGIWIGFFLFIALALSIDTFKITNIRPNESIKAALFWVSVWVTCALLFNLVLWIYLRHTATPAIANEKAIQFFTGYLIEESLSVDNLFVFYTIFHQFHIPLKYQHRVLSIGIWSAIIMRLMIILFATWLVLNFHWFLYVLGAFLLLTGIRMLFIKQEKEKKFVANKIYDFLKQHMRISHELHGQHFFIRKNNLIYATPLFVTLICIEISDLIFAFDSIPAIFAITTDPFIIWTSNIFAILGLRAMYFIVANMITRFHLLKYGIALILVFVGFKMVIEPWLYISSKYSLIIIAGILITFTLLSLYTNKIKKLNKR